jgi:uncharacterized protein YndB with AHSA1/START domain
MATANISADRDAVVTEIEIAAPPERVFQALVTRDQALQWGTDESYETTQWELEARPGGSWRFTAKERKTGKEYRHYGEVLEIDPPRLLCHTWLADFHEIPAQRTVVRWELTPVKAGTRLKVTHSGLALLPVSGKSYAEGWPGLLQHVRKFIEKK